MTVRGRHLGAFLLVAVGALVACRREAPLPSPDLVAKVGERELKAGAFDLYLQRNLGESGGGLASEVLSGLFDQFVREEMLAMLARDRKLVESDAPASAAVEALLAAQPAGPPSESEVASYFAAHGAEFARPARVHLRQILVEDRLVAERARRELLAGASFESVLAKTSAPGTAPLGGDQGILARDELPPAFADLIFRLEIGRVSEVVAAEYGFHLFEVVERWPAQSPGLAEVAPEIRRRLQEQAADKRLGALFADAQSRYTVVVFDRNLPFNYRGSLPISRPHEER